MQLLSTDLKRTAAAVSCFLPHTLSLQWSRPAASTRVLNGQARKLKRSSYRKFPCFRSPTACCADSFFLFYFLSWQGVLCTASLPLVGRHVGRWRLLAGRMLACDPGAVQRATLLARLRDAQVHRGAVHWRGCKVRPRLRNGFCGERCFLLFCFVYVRIHILRRPSAGGRGGVLMPLQWNIYIFSTRALTDAVVLILCIHRR